jgi:hypothetical protein
MRGIAPGWLNDLHTHTHTHTGWLNDQLPQYEALDLGAFGSHPHPHHPRTHAPTHLPTHLPTQPGWLNDLPPQSSGVELGAFGSPPGTTGTTALLRLY